MAVSVRVWFTIHAFPVEFSNKVKSEVKVTVCQRLTWLFSFLRVMCYAERSSLDQWRRRARRFEPVSKLSQ